MYRLQMKCLQDMRRWMGKNCWHLLYPLYSIRKRSNFSLGLHSPPNWATQNQQEFRYKRPEWHLAKLLTGFVEPWTSTRIKAKSTKHVDRTHAPIWHQRNRIAVELAEVNRDARVHEASRNCWWHKRICTHQKSILNMPSPSDILGWIQLWIIHDTCLTSGRFCPSTFLLLLQR